VLPCWLVLRGLCLFFSTYGVSFRPLGVGYRATKVFVSGWSILVVRVCTEFFVILVGLISCSNIINRRCSWDSLLCELLFCCLLLSVT
jgi:hypothetical protein